MGGNRFKGCACNKGFKLQANKKSCAKPGKPAKPGVIKASCKFVKINKSRRRSWTCTCPAGWKKIPGSKCRKRHPCDVKRGGCQYRCNRLGSLAKCTCQKGW